ncbi:MAG: CO dehydrogenase/acetyl-CoA synthase complex subunit epsilon [Candidatus Hydrothermarchaeales archaeon]
MTYATSWSKSHHAGPKRALAVDSDVAGRILEKSNAPVIVIGARIKELNGEVLDRVIKLAKEMKIPVVATAHSGKFLVEKGFKDYVEMGVVEVTNLLADPEWGGINGAGKYDLVIVVGAHLDLMNATFQTLKNFTKVPSLCIDRYFMVNANYSFPNLNEEMWLSYLDGLMVKLGILD